MSQKYLNALLKYYLSATNSNKIPIQSDIYQIKNDNSLKNQPSLLHLHTIIID